MAKRAKKKSKKTTRRKTKAVPKKRKPARKVTKKRSSSRKAARKTARKPRRKESEMLPREVRASRLRKSGQREGRIERDFRRAVNMTPAALEKWLQSSESREGGAGMAWAGQRTLEVLRSSNDRSPEDYSHMRKVSAYVTRQLARKPEGDVRDTSWRHGLMNWGHDPLK